MQPAFGERNPLLELVEHTLRHTVNHHGKQELTRGVVESLTFNSPLDIVGVTLSPIAVSHCLASTLVSFGGHIMV